MTSDTYSLTSFCFSSETRTLVEKTTQKALGYNDVLIKTTHSGICFTDVHAKEKECGLGHEGVGDVIQVGPAVTHLKVGDRVGWRWLHISCGHCSTCVTGYRQYCSEARAFAFSDLDQGAFGDYRIINSEFAYKLPKGIPSVNAAPLMCAGASVFEALDAAGAKSNDRVGVVGIGGLGHMAILFAKAMGCGVTAISNGDRKKDDAFELGADEFRDSTAIVTSHRPSGTVEDPNAMSINVLLITSNAVPALETVLPLFGTKSNYRPDDDPNGTLEHTVYAIRPARSSDDCFNRSLSREPYQDA